MAVPRVSVIISPRRPISPRDDREGLREISDTAALEKILDEAIAASPKQVEQYRSGKTGVIGYLVGIRGQGDEAEQGAVEPGGRE
jgi:aspartyl-tRNA(Asn)/glutamyl-tRNA(Gln) amidotransferase subunit B